MHTNVNKFLHSHIVVDPVKGLGEVMIAHKDALTRFINSTKNLIDQINQIVHCRTVRNIPILFNVSMQ